MLSTNSSCYLDRSYHYLDMHEMSHDISLLCNIRCSQNLATKINLGVEDSQ
jgi:hypothetical protein